MATIKSQTIFTTVRWTIEIDGEYVCTCTSYADAMKMVAYLNTTESY